ncbi:uncharacterized protein LOC112349576 [Selaginella moellendorffii]|uniref:uncharacterized protein LOC112349576 n=1 Tax=Selaginella moellendorffii TaxID=88036 RepID=UPI000D1CB0AE|nr:uncharacterized protein LOC112349576 [Selaginella moellendorffii]|eukprot:XP_024539965.1 uncharacterized protein LOC112349576 [Selaginella moellendorffii]
MDTKAERALAWKKRMALMMEREKALGALQNIYVCDRLAQDLINHPQTQELGAWADKKKSSTALYCLGNHKLGRQEEMLGWGIWEAMCGSNAITRKAPYFLRALGFGEEELGDEELLDAMEVFMHASCLTTLPEGPCFSTSVVFVTGSQRFYQALARDENSWRKMSLLITYELHVCASPYSANDRVWPILPDHTEPVEQCIIPGAKRSKKIPEFGTPFRVPCPTISQLYSGEYSRFPWLHELLDVYDQAKLDLPAEAASHRVRVSGFATLSRALETQSSVCFCRNTLHTSPSSSKVLLPVISDF